MWRRAHVVLRVGVFLCFSQALQKLEQQIALLPRSNYNLLSYICRWVGGGEKSNMGVSLGGPGLRLMLSSVFQVFVWGAAEIQGEQNECGELGHSDGDQPAQTSDRRPHRCDERLGANM